MSSTPRAGRSRAYLLVRRIRLKWLRISDPLLGRARAQWRRSLKLRTMTITALVTGFMILIAGTYILSSVRDDLFDSRRDQVLDDSARATKAAQSQIDASVASDRGSLLALSAWVRGTVQTTSSSQYYYVRRQAEQPPSADAPDGFYTSAALLDVLTPELSEAVREGNAPQYWQSVLLQDEQGQMVPGIVVASTLTFPAGAGEYDLVIGYSLADTERTIGVIARTLLLTAIFLMLLIGGLVWVISRIVFRPILAAADASRRLAAGEAEARMPLQGDEHFDELSENFNNMADTLQARIDELDHLSEMQQRFVSDVSHELRTPLTTIRLASEVLRSQDHGDDPARARPVEVLGTQIDRFERLLTDLLEISRYDAGRIIIETEPTNLVTLVEEIVEGLRPLSASEIVVHTLGGFSPVDIDARRVRRIVSNLVGNAIEHGEGHPIDVTIDSNAGAVAIGVRDSGIGLTPEHLVHVFDRFWRADPSRKRTLGGTGLGLAIAREDAAVHGGTLEAWSRPGEGSHFRLTLPRGENETYVSPIPLVPLDVASDDVELETTGRWLRRAPWRRGRRRSSERGAS